MTVRVIREADVEALVGMPEALEAVETAFVEQAGGSGINEPRRRVRQPNGTLHLLGGALMKRGYWGFKAYTATREAVRFVVNLYDVRSGALLALIEADRLGQLRTGAASGIATKYLARPDAAVLALFGTGFQAEAQLAAIAAVRELRATQVYSRTPERRDAFAAKMSAQLGVPVLPVDTPSAALAGADIITTITTASGPVFNGNELRPGTHINAAGSNAAIRIELDLNTIRRADRIYTDDLAQARIESGDLITANERNACDWARVRPLADVVAGLIEGRPSPEAITLFESQGIALWDIALAATIYERATAAGLGTELAFG